MATGYDAIDPASIPAEVAPPNYCFGYIDGRWPSYLPMAARFPLAIPVSISAIPGSAQSPFAQVADCESGDYTPDQAAGWARSRLAAGFVPCVYCSLSEWPTVQSACQGLQVDWWVAAYPGNGAQLYPGSIGHQWIDHGTYDESVIQDGWIPGRLLHQPFTEEEDMPLYTTNSKGTGFVVAADLSHKQGIPDAQDALNLLNTGLYKEVALDDQLIDAIP